MFKSHSYANVRKQKKIIHKSRSYDDVNNTNKQEKYEHDNWSVSYLSNPNSPTMVCAVLSNICIHDQN